MQSIADYLRETSMRLFPPVIFLLALWGTPAFAESSDQDGVADQSDNCSEVPNAAQDDTDGDGCGNACDADYDQNGAVGFPDFGIFLQCFGTADELCQHVEPIGGGRLVGFPDFGFFSANFSSVPGPSGPTSGTTACP
jgi:hypothetical protein